MTNLIYDPWFYAVAIPAVLFVGLSKGGLGGAMGQLGVPLLALVVSPVQGAAIMLPILILMDIVALWSWRGFRDVQTLKIMLPGAMIGIFIGYLTAKMVTDDMVKLIVGVLGIWFIIRHLITARQKIVEAQPHNAGWGGFWGIAVRVHQFCCPCGRPALPDLHPAFEGGAENICWHKHCVFCGGQCCQADSLFCSRAI